MKTHIIVIICVLVAGTVSAPRGSAPTKILRSDIKHKLEGSYTIDVETDDGTKRQETGTLTEVPNEEEKLVKVIVIHGSFTYKDPEGHPQTVTYTADETGFHAQGDPIPKTPKPSIR